MAMTSRERVGAALARRRPDRVPIHDSLWRATLSRWHREGLPEEIPPAEQFGFEITAFGCDCSPRYPIRILERSPTFIVETTATGGVRRNFRDYSTTPEIVDWGLKTKADWTRIRPRLEPDVTRVDWVSLRGGFERAREEGQFIVFSAALGYDLLQSYMKSDELLVALATEPDWVTEMFHAHADLVVAMARIVLDAGFDFDGAWMYDDLGYRNGLLFSPATYRRTLLAADAKVCDFFHGRGMPVILHSCGGVKELIPHLIEAGFDCLQPLEVKAGMDLRELVPAFGDRMAFMGGIDVRAMGDPDPARIEDEIAAKFEVAKQSGGYIYHSDHSVPKDVSLRRYERVLELVRRYGDYGGGAGPAH